MNPSSGMYLNVLETTTVQIGMNVYFSRYSARLGTVDKHKLVTQIQLVISRCWEGSTVHFPTSEIDT